MRKAADNNRLDLPLRERFTEPPKIRFQPPHHHRLEVFRPNLHAAREALWIQHFEQRGEAVGVPVVRRCREKQAVPKPLGKIADSARQLTRNGVACAA